MDSRVTQNAGRFAELVREHQAMVFSIAFHFLHDSAVAEELSQDVFLSLYRELPRLESPSHVKFWLRKVISHRAMDYMRTIRRRRELALEQIPEPIGDAKLADPLLEASVRKLVASLPHQARMIVVLRYQEDMEPHEIGKVVGLPTATVKSRLHRSLAVLRGKAERLMGGPIR